MSNVVELRTLLSVSKGDASIKMPVIVRGSGKSNDDAEAVCWRHIRQVVQDAHPGATFRVRAMWYEIVRSDHPILTEDA